MNKLNYLFTIFMTILTLLTFHNLFPQVNQEWAARYNGPGNDYDQAYSIAADNTGNVYVAGQSFGSGTSSDYATIKYNSSGIQQWVRRYNGPGNDFDESFSLTIDSLSNVYVTGYSTGSGTGNDYATIKYNSSGLQQWIARYNGTGNGTDKASAIAVDDSGNVYVTGWSFGSGTGFDYVTIKYNSSGTEQWVSRIEAAGNDYARSLAVDDSGNVYVTGYRFTVSNYDYCTVRYNSSGDVIWIAGYNGAGNDEAFSIAADRSGNVYVTGFSTDSIGSQDYETIKYNLNGIQQWTAKYRSPGANGGASSLALDVIGNIYVTGSSAGNTGYDFATIKYNTEGDSLWTARYNGPDIYSDDNSRSIAIDRSGNVYVTGYSSSTATYEDYATIKYDSTGMQQWEQRYSRPGFLRDVSTDIAIDGYGNVYVTGYSSEENGIPDYATIKYSQTTDITRISSDIPEKYSLSQNYPNPFNPVTNLEFGISDLGFVSLKIYDVLGKEVATLVNEKLSQGNYKVEFDGSGFSSGVYFYRLVVSSSNPMTARDFTDTKRMMLIK